MRVIRALRDIHVPQNPEYKEGVYRSVQRGLLTLVHDDYLLPKDSYQEIVNLELVEEKTSKKKKK